ncbi:MAG: branched-chain amino acid dehydrogenase [Gracilibacter sp. BRH_c7a]|nr:MAG: branched-chain amino acid dehydrogenase [Gracilibacter sp. BRH_c7a]
MSNDKLKSAPEAIKCISSGSVVMIGGFMGCGSPKYVLDKLAETNVRNLTVISNDTDFEGVGVGKLVKRGMISRLIASHIGTNPETGRKLNSGEIAVELNPQGTLAERIRAGGAGLGGFLTPTGFGTIIENGKKKMEINGQTYLLETPLKADVALIKAYKADEFGNLVFRGATRNFNLIMATAAEYVIAEVEEHVRIGGIDPEDVMLPGIFVDCIVRGCAQNVQC